MVLDARRKGFEICPKSLQPVGPAFEAYARIFEYRPEAAAPPTPEPSPTPPFVRVVKTRHALGRLPWIAAATLLLLALSRACAG
jgi:hypothetical protein